MDSAYGTRGWLLAGLVASMYLTGCSDDPAEPAEPGSEAGNEAGNRAQSGESGESGVSGAGGRRTGSAGGGGGRTSESAADGGGVGGPGAPGRPDAGADAGEAGTGATAGANGAAGALGPGAGSAAEGGAGGLGGAPAEAGSGGPAAPELTPEPADEAAFVFDPSALRTYDIQVAPADLALINQNPRTEMKVPAMVEVDGQVYGPYAVRYKGSEGAFMYPCTQGAPGGPKYGKCSLKLDFNDADPEGRFFGLKQLNFHALNADTSMLRERLGYQLFRDNGIAAPRSGYARVLINGELEGLFALVEQIDGRFTRARFGDGGEGNLYKEIWPAYDDPAVYSAALETNEDQQPSVQRMVDFKTAITTSADAAESFVDRDYFLRYLAVDRVTINDDGIFRFWCNAGVSQGNNPGPFGNHNYYWYEEITRPRLWLIPWDLDNGFDNTPAVHVDPAWNVTAECACHSHPEFGQQWPAACDPLVQRFIGWQTDLDTEIDAFIAGPFAKARVDGLIEQYRTHIQSAVAESAGLKQAPSESAWADAIVSLQQKIDSAREHRGYAY